MDEQDRIKGPQWEIDVGLGVSCRLQLHCESQADWLTAFALRPTP
jgi:hypothetical protein